MCEELPVLIKEGAFTHDGFLVRITSGFTFGNLHLASNDSRGSRDDGALFGDLAVDVGSSVARNLILRGRLWGEAFGFRDSDFGKREVGLAGGLGAGVDYYFMPVNVYVGATVGVAGIMLVDVQEPDEDRPGRARRSKAGLGIDLDAGKEWWITGNWGLGVGLRLRWLNAAPARIGAPSDGRLNSFQGGLHFSITYN